MQAGFVDLSEAVPGILTDIRYATARNLTGRPLAGYRAAKAVATREAAEALAIAFQEARRLGYGMLIYDAYRPQKAVDNFVRWSREPETGETKAAFYPELDKTELFELGYIAEKSGHSRGSTIDLTLTDPAGVPLDMGACFDFMGERSHHGAAGLTARQHRNRALLRAIMAYAGFAPYENEWWHYRLMGEPYPDTYFNFDIE